MGQGSTHGPIDIGKVQSIVDGTLCRAPSWQPGPLDVFAAGPQAAIFFGERYFYCEVWSEGDRTAFWRGVGDRVVEYGEQAWAVIVWLRDAVGLGDDGGFDKAWSELGHALVSMAHLNFKLMVVLGIPPILSLHPSRQAYQDELFNLGVHIAKDAVEGYRKAYSAGGLPQCTGRLFVDILVLVIEALATKGAGKLLESTKLARLTRLLPKKLQDSLPNMKAKVLGKSAVMDSEIAEMVERGFIEEAGVSNAPASLPRPRRPAVTGRAAAARKQFETVRDGYAQTLGVRSGGQVHHAIELQVLDRYPGVFTEQQLNALQNMRGIETELAARRQLHNSKVREIWDRHYRRIDDEIARRGLQPESQTYNQFVRTNIEEAKREIDHVIGQFFTEIRRPAGL